MLVEGADIISLDGVNSKTEHHISFNRQHSVLHIYRVNCFHRMLHNSDVNCIKPVMHNSGVNCTHLVLHISRVNYIVYCIFLM